MGLPAFQSELSKCQLTVFVGDTKIRKKHYPQFIHYIGIRCGPVIVPTNGEVTCSNGDEYGSVCSFGCQLGFELVGVEKLR